MRQDKRKEIWLNSRYSCYAFRLTKKPCWRRKRSGNDARRPICCVSLFVVCKVMGLIAMNSFAVLTSSDSNEWYTPEWVFDCVRQIGEIGLDPASNPIAQQWIKADRHYTREDDGFNRPWGTDKGLWLNPPYGTKGNGCYGASAWIEKAIAEYSQGSFPWAVLLVRGDSKGIHWLESGFISCEPYNRISFFCPTDPNKKNPVPGCRFWYLGTQPDRFASAFNTVGAIRAPWRAIALSLSV